MGCSAQSVVSAIGDDGREWGGDVNRAQSGSNAESRPVRKPASKSRALTSSHLPLAH
jgi:hypothetical protein